MARGAAVALVALTTLLTSACAAGSGGVDSTAAFEDVRQLAAAAERDDGALLLSTVTAVGACLAGSRQGDDPAAIADAMSSYGVAAFETYGSHPVWTDRVECSAPHEIEVYGIVSLPRRLENAVVSYAGLVDPQTRVYHAVDAEISHACATAYAPAAEAAGSSRLRVDVVPVWTPAVPASFAWAPAPDDAWDAGDHTFACLFEQRQPGTLRLDDVSASTFPADGRVCLSRTTFVSCSRNHDSERIATIVADRAVERGQIPGVSAIDAAGKLNLGAASWRQLDALCEAYLAAVAPEHAAGLHGVANSYPELYPDADGRFVVICSAQAAFGAGQRVVTSRSVFD